MRILFMITGAVIATALSTAPPVLAARSKTETSQVKPSEVAVLRAIVEQGYKKFRAREWEAARESLLAATGNPAFADMPPAFRYFTLHLLALSEHYGKDNASAYEHILAAAQTSPENRDFSYWTTLSEIAFAHGRKEEAGDAAIKAVRDFPGDLKDYDTLSLLSLARKMDEIGDGRARYQTFLEALKAADYKGNDPFWTVEILWLDLFTIYADRGDEAKARAMAESLIQPHSVMRRQIDKRYIRYAPSDPNAYANAVAAMNARDTKLASDHPDMLEGVRSQADQLKIGNQLPQALKVVDDALAKVDAAPKDKPAFRDLNEKYEWVLYTRASILRHMGRYDEALTTQQKSRDAAAKRDADGISQKVNLANLLVDMGRPAEAIAELDTIKAGDSSPYGVMATEGVRACAYAQQKDATGLAKSLAYLRAHGNDNEEALTASLLCADDLTAVAQRLIMRIEDPLKRGQALSDVQIYLRKTHPTAWQKTIDERHDRVLARPDVRAIIEKYGVVSSYPIFYEPY